MRNKNTILTALILFLLLGEVRAQNFEWARAFGGSNTDVGNSIAVDTSGNVYTTGSFQGTVDFDPGVGVYNLTSYGANDVFVQKIDASGNFVWAKSFGGASGNASGRSIAVDASGNVYTTGYFEGTVDFDPETGVDNHTSNGDYDIFVHKMDASGNFIWVSTFGGVGINYGSSIAVDTSGNVYTTGSFQNTVDFDPGTGIDNHTSNGNYDVFVHKMDTSGNFIWARTFGGVGSMWGGDEGYSIAVDASGNVYTTGSFLGTVDFDPGTGVDSLTSNGTNDVFVHKMDASGNFVWARAFGGAIYDNGNSIYVDTAGNVYTTGYFYSSVDFDPGTGVDSHTSNGSSDIFVHKMDASGSFLWVKTFGGNNWDRGLSIALDTSGNIYTTGNFYDSVDFDPSTSVDSHTSNGNYDVFVHKMDASGNFLWVKTFGGNNNDKANSVAVDASGNVYTTGSFENTVDFDPSTSVNSHTSNGSSDIFVHKMSPCVLTRAENYTGCQGDGYSVTVNGTTYNETNPTGTETLTNAAGCDSVVNVNLVFNAPNTVTDTQTACNSFTWIDGLTYTSSNSTATHTLTSAIGCDSVVTLNLTINSVNVATSVSGETITADLTGATYQWINCSDNSVIAGETAQSFTATTNGDYAVIVTDGSCADTSACVTINSTSIEENNISFSIHPNPTNGEVNIVSDFAVSKIEIFSATGLKVMESKATTLNISKVKSGVYFVKVHTEQGASTQRIIKE